MERICYDFFCMKFGTCDRARGMGCNIEREPEVFGPDGMSSHVQPGECTKENDFPYYVQSVRSRRSRG